MHDNANDHNVSTENVILWKSVEWKMSLANAVPRDQLFLYQAKYSLKNINLQHFSENFLVQNE